MTALRILLVPAMLLAAIFAWVAISPGGTTVANPDTTATPSPSYTPSATPTGTPVPDLPDGVWGTLTYRTGHELVRVRFPQIIEEQRYTPPPAPLDNLSSAYGWWVQFSGDDNCVAALHDDARGNAGLYAMQLQACPRSEWSADRTRIAFTTLTVDNRNQFIVIDGESPSVRVLFDSPSTSINTFAWSDDRLLVGGNFDGRSGIRWLALDGTLSTIDDVAAPMYFYPSPDRSRFLFTQSAPEGWQLWMLDAATSTVTNLGNMGSDGGDVAPPLESSPENTGKGGPMYIAWSPDGTKVAFGGGFEPPYIMTTVDLNAGTKAVTEFPSGYPGEIRWSADGKQIAVSTYDIERTHHETWVVDPDTGAGRHLMDGCVIVWSPDGRFLAVHGEDVPGITIINIDTAERAQLTHNATDAPIEWTE